MAKRIWGITDVPILASHSSRHGSRCWLSLDEGYWPVFSLLATFGNTMYSRTERCPHEDSSQASATLVHIARLLFNIGRDIAYVKHGTTTAVSESGRRSVGIYSFSGDLIGRRRAADAQRKLNYYLGNIVTITPTRWFSSVMKFIPMIGGHT